MSDNRHVTDLLPAHALGCLDEEEATLVARHLAGCTACRAELLRFQEIAGDLALTAPEEAPPPDLKRRLLRRIQRPGPERVAPPAWSRRPLAQRLLPAWGVVSLLLILALTMANLALWQRLGRLERAMTPGGMQAIPLTGANVVTSASGFILVSADGHNGALVVDGLAPLDAEWEYQLWLIQNGGRTSGAVFSVDEHGYGGTRITAPVSLFEYGAAGVTIEPAGGSPGPTGDQVLTGSLFTP